MGFFSVPGLLSLTAGRRADSGLAGEAGAVSLPLKTKRQGSRKMKEQIVRFSPLQNAKVVAILMAVGSLIFLIPMYLAFAFFVPAVDQHGHPTNFPAFMFLIFPVVYLIFGYIFTVIGCAIYNFFFKYIGGFEFESREEESGH